MLLCCIIRCAMVGTTYFLFKQVSIQKTYITNSLFYQQDLSEVHRPLLDHCNNGITCNM